MHAVESFLGTVSSGEGSSSVDFQGRVCLLARVMSTMFLERHFAADSFIHSRCIIVDA